MIRDDIPVIVKHADAAMEEAADVVLQRARQHNTPIVLWRDGKVVELDPFSPEFDESKDNATAPGDEYANIANYPEPLKQAGIYFSQAIVWDKQHPVMTRKDMMGAFEICFYGWKEGAGHKFYGPANATDLWHIKKVNPQAMVHLTEKPVELAVRAIEYSSKLGQNVLDLFGGSGSTLIGAEQTGRNAYLMELDPPYCDVIVQRWKNVTGKDAIRVDDQTR